MNHEELLTKFANMADFRQEVWKAYIDSRFPLYKALLEKHQAAEARRKEIEEQAAKEQTLWHAVIKMFNDRFFVPFKLEASNKVDVILGRQEMLSLGFVFDDGVEQVSVERSSLLQALSAGEKKALYVLNILFEIEVRKQAGQDTLVIVDDIADSFDYKNKYAIIQYLMDISENSHFKQIILTHNFDFFRTVQSRFVGYGSCLMASKTASGVALEKAAGIQNVFINDWKPAFYGDPKKKIASIPFMRNLIEYTKSDVDPEFVKLTSLLHWKSDSDLVTVADLDTIYNNIFGNTSTSPDGRKTIMALVSEEATKCLSAPDGINFENKVVLAIATRIAAEQYMIKKINDSDFVAAIPTNQTRMLLTKFKELFFGDAHSTGVLQRVALMTPENIHLNSFMYEPILDMSDHHLRALYRDVLALA